MNRQDFLNLLDSNICQSCGMTLCELKDGDVKKKKIPTIQQFPVAVEEGAVIELALLFWPFPLCLWPPLLLPPPPDFGYRGQNRKHRFRWNTPSK